MEPSPWMGPPESMQKDLFLFWFLFCYYFFFVFFCFFFLRENCNFWIPDMFSGGPIQGLGSIFFVFLFCFFCEGKLQFLDSGHVFWGAHPGTGFHLFFFFFFVFFFLIFPFGPILDLFFWFVFFLFFNLFLDFGFVGGVSTVKTWNELSSMFQFSGFGFNSFLSCKKSTRLQGVTWRF